MGSLQDPLIWIDLEMTGLDPDKDRIIEIFCIITDGQLNIVDPTGFGVVVSCPVETLNGMDAWCTKTHGDSGLTKAALESSITPEMAAEQLLAYIKKYVPDERHGLMAGNSIHVDRMFLRKEPYRKVYDHVHYRILDVSAIMEAVRRWCPPEVRNAEPRKQGLHQAKQDILDSIEQAKFYKELIFSSVHPPSLPKDISSQTLNTPAEVGTEKAPTQAMISTPAPLKQPCGSNG